MSPLPVSGLLRRVLHSTIALALLFGGGAYSALGQESPAAAGARDLPPRTPADAPASIGAAAISSATAATLAQAMDIRPEDLLNASLGSSSPAGAGVSTSPLSHFPLRNDSFAILSTGLASSAGAPNNASGLSYVLDGLNNTQGNDLVQLTLDLRVPDQQNCLSVDFAYYSEEYPEFVGSWYNDTFTAELGGASFSIVGHEVVAPQNFAFDRAGQIISVNTVFGTSATSSAGTTYDGGTLLLRARRVVTPGQTIRLVFSIQDLGDSIYDSAVFLDNLEWFRSDSCSAGGQLTSKPVIMLVHGVMLFDKYDGDRCNSTVPLGPWPKDWAGPAKPDVWDGYGESEEYFGPFREWLADAGYRVYQARLTAAPLLSMDGTASLQVNADCLDRQIDWLYSNPASPDQGRPIVLVAHSMGGLISRAYLGSLSSVELGRIKALYTFGSPHAGINAEFIVKYLVKNFKITTPVGSLPVGATGWAAFCYVHKAVCQFTTDAMVTFNRNYPNRAGVRYVYVGGDSSDAYLNLLGVAMQAGLLATDGPNDVAIGKYSAVGHRYIPFCLFGSCSDQIGGRAAEKFWTGEVHGLYPIEGADGEPAGGMTYFEYKPPYQADSDYNTWSRSFLCLKDWLDGRTSMCAPAAGLSDAGASQAETISDAVISMVDTPSVSGTLLGGQTVTHEVLVDTDGQALFNLTWVSGSLEFTLTRPDGQVIDPGFVAAHPDLGQYAFAADPSGVAPYAIYSLIQSWPGPWTLTIHNPTSAPIGYSAFASLASPRSLVVSLDRYLYQIGQTAHISATVTGLSGGISGLSVAARVQRSDGAVDIMALADLGAGVYAADYVIPNAPGATALSVTASGVSDGLAFARAVNRSLAVQPDLVLLNGQVAGQPVDHDGNGLYDRLEVSVGLTAPYAGEYSVAGRLIRDGQVIGSAVAHSMLEAGAAVVTLQFQGNDIRAARLNGPYVLTDLQVTDLQYGSIPAQTIASAWTSPAYAWQSFGSCYTLSSGPIPSFGGSVMVSPTPNCNGGTQYAYGTAVTLTAKPAANFGFANWIVDAAGSAGTTTVVMDGPKTIKANFAPLRKVFLPLIRR